MKRFNMPLVLALAVCITLPVRFARAELEHDYELPEVYVIKRLTPEPEAESESERLLMRTDRLTDSEKDDASFDPSVLGNAALRRSKIRAIEFADSLDGIGNDAWDVSNAQNGAVLAWTTDEAKGKRLTIAADGGVFAPGDCSYLFARYVNLEQIRFNGCFHTDYAVDMRGMFQGCERLKSLDPSGFDTGNVLNMRDMFSGCGSLEELDVSCFDTGNVKSMQGMFRKCSALKRLALYGFDTRNVKNMSYMFYECTDLEYLNVSSFDTGNVTDMDHMFSKCGSLRSLDVRGFRTGLVKSMRDMFNGCGSLEELDVSGFDTGSVTDMYRMFNRCKQLKSLDLSGFVSDKVTDTTKMFSNCISMERVDVGEGFVLVDRIELKTEDMFASCPTKLECFGNTFSPSEWMKRATIKTDMILGDRGNSVKWVQRVLAKLGYQPGDADGVFGEDTDQALRHFQLDTGVGRDGVVDGVTVETLCRRVAVL